MISRQLIVLPQVVEDRSFGTTASAVEAAVKRQEAISADILARRDRFRDLDEMAETLHAESYHDKDRIIGRDREISNRLLRPRCYKMLHAEDCR